MWSFVVLPSNLQTVQPLRYHSSAGWSSLVARWAHNPKVGGSNPPPATNFSWSLIPQIRNRIKPNSGAASKPGRKPQSRLFLAKFLAIRFGEALSHQRGNPFQNPTIC